MLYRLPACATVVHSSTNSLTILSTSCLSIYQTLKSLADQKYGFCMCLNRNELILMCGVGVILQALQCSRGSVTQLECIDWATCIMQHLTAASVLNKQDSDKVFSLISSISPRSLAKHLPEQTCEDRLTTTRPANTMTHHHAHALESEELAVGPVTMFRNPFGEPGHMSQVIFGYPSGLQGSFSSSHNGSFDSGFVSMGSLPRSWSLRMSQSV